MTRCVTLTAFKVSNNEQVVSMTTFLLLCVIPLFLIFSGESSICVFMQLLKTDEYISLTKFLDSSAAEASIYWANWVNTVTADARLSAAMDEDNFNYPNIFMSRNCGKSKYFSQINSACREFKLDVIYLLYIYLSLQIYVIY